MRIVTNVIEWNRFFCNVTIDYFIIKNCDLGGHGYLSVKMNEWMNKYIINWLIKWMNNWNIIYK